MNTLQLRVVKKQLLTKTEYIFQAVLLLLLMAGGIPVLLSGFPSATSGQRLFSNGLFDGVFVLINDFLLFLTQEKGAIYLDFATGETANAPLFFCLLMAIFSLLAAFAIYRKHLLWIILYSLVLFIGIGTDFLEAKPSLLFFLTGLILFFLYKKELICFQKQPLKQILFLCLLLLLTVLSAVFVSTFINKSTITQLQKRADSVFHKHYYNCNGNNQPEGHLSNLEGRDITNTSALEIKTKYPQKLYLRGFIGESYTGISWESFSKETYGAYENTFYWLHKSDFYGQKIIASAAKAIEETDCYNLQIQTTGACHKYQYLPYGLASHNTLEKQKIGDSGATANSDSISVSCLKATLPDWYKTKLTLAKNTTAQEVQNFLKLEQTYRAFIYEQNLQITEQAASVCARIFGENNNPKTLQEIQDAIRSVLDKSLTYNETIHTLNGTNDFFQYTFEQSKRGYSVHYATAATLMFRYFGVPARYVEGYFLSADEASRYNADDTIILTDAHAHAWPEIYLEGIGWIPFEVTPGYIDNETLSSGQHTDLNSDNTLQQEMQFEQNDLTYIPPDTPEDLTKLTELDIPKDFPFNKEQLLCSFIILLLLLVLLFMFFFVKRILKKRKKLLQFKESIRQSENRKAIILLFAYGNKLLDLANISNPVSALSDYETVKAIHKEAFFSNHKMSDLQQEQTLQFVKDATALCKKNLPIYKRFIYHFICCYY